MNKEDKSLFLPLVALLVAVTSFLICWKMLMPSVADNQAKIQAYNSDISSAEEKIQSLTEASKKITSITDVVSNILVAIPEDVDTPNLVTEIETIAAVNQVLLPSISPPDNTSETAIKSGQGLSTTISISGGFTNIYNFISALESSIRFSKITSLSLSSSDDDALNATITFEVYKRPSSSANIASGGDYE